MRNLVENNDPLLDGYSPNQLRRLIEAANEVIDWSGRSMIKDCAAHDEDVRTPADILLDLADAIDAPKREACDE